ncbi:MAG: hypothetical protein VST68_11020 [Nitrospirota bacterium]|nr:hypothetical protein [Nitrospirota bacterium]
MKRYLIVAFVYLLLMTPSLLLAHGSAKHVMGTVTETAQDHIVVKTTKGKMVTVAINSETILDRNGITAKGIRPEVGNRVIAETMKDGDQLIAKELHFSSSKTK